MPPHPLNAPQRTYLHWRKSSRSDSGPGQCIEVAAARSTIAIRDSKLATGQFPYLSVSNDDWAGLLHFVKAD